MKCLFIFLLALAFHGPSAQAAVTLLDKDDWKFSVSGFVELDTIFDSTRGFLETIGNTAVPRGDALAGQMGRSQFSMRNSRLAFAIEPPVFDDWKSKGYLEFDLLGYEPVPPAASEGSTFDNPTFRVRHAYLSAVNNGWQLLAGQTWAFMGWQPYYFVPVAQVAPIPAMLYSRTEQIRAVKTIELSEENQFQVGLGIMRPPQEDSQFPGLEGGLRLAMGSRTSGFTGGSTGAQRTQPMSLAISGTVRDFAVPHDALAPTDDQDHYVGSAIAIDTLIPVLASSDGKDVSNTLTLGAEFTTGKGYGDQFNAWSGNLPSPLNLGAAPYKGVDLDTGIGGFNSANAFELIDLQTFNAHLQYHLPAATRTWLSAGFSWLYSDNMASFTIPVLTAGTAAAKIGYNKEMSYFGNIFHDLTPQIRVALEFIQVQTTYVDGSDAHDNRYQVSAWFIF